MMPSIIFAIFYSCFLFIFRFSLFAACLFHHILEQVVRGPFFNYVYKICPLFSTYLTPVNIGKKIPSLLLWKILILLKFSFTPTYHVLSTQLKNGPFLISSYFFATIRTFCSIELIFFVKIIVIIFEWKYLCISKYYS